jgi:hypothetical protein
MSLEDIILPAHTLQVGSVTINFTSNGRETFGGTFGEGIDKRRQGCSGDVGSSSSSYGGGVGGSNHGEDGDSSKNKSVAEAHFDDNEMNKKIRSCKVKECT